MKTYSLTEFRDEMFKVFGDIDTTRDLYIHRRRKIYRVHITKTPKRITSKYHIALVKKSRCKQCKGITINRVCMRGCKLPLNAETP